MGVSMTTVRAVRERGHDAVHLREQALQKLPDDEILRKAVNESRIILTFDLDFGDLIAASGGRTPSTILFRMRNQTPVAVTPRLLEVIETCEEALASGALIVVEDHRYRLRSIPIQKQYRRTEVPNG
jgi:predicted nuclease of predicted toxin-antitoxin system